MGNQYQNPGTSLPVAYAHTVDYFSKGIDAQGPFYKVKYYINNWADADTMVNALRGVTTNTGGTGGTTTKVSPHQHPLSPNLYCVSAVAEGNGGVVTNANGYPSYANGAVIAAEYRPMVPFGFQETAAEQLQNIDPLTPLVWCTQELEFGVEATTIPNTQATWQAGPLSGQAVGRPFRVQVPLVYLMLTFQKLPYLPVTAVRNCVGKINNATFLGATSGQVLFKGAKTTRDYNTDGTVCQKVQLSFAQRPTSWNTLLCQDDLNYYLVAAGTQTIYQTADFSQLLVF